MFDIFHFMHGITKEQQGKEQKTQINSRAKTQICQNQNLTLNQKLQIRDAEKIPF